jgi:hypothetical protein
MIEEPQSTEGDISLAESVPVKALENSSAQLHGIVIAPGETASPLENAKLINNESKRQGASAASSSRNKMARSSSKTRDSSSPSSRVLPTVGAYAVQCVECLKWRFIPSKEQYEAIRHCASEDPWVCNKASAWRPNASCDNPTDLSPDMTRLWIIDKPNIPLPPTGWERLLSLREKGTCKFADVYYITPCGKKLRSRVEVEKFLEDNPQYGKEGVNISQFNYQIPRPLHDSYLRKRTASEAQIQGNTGRNSKIKISSHEEK